MDNRRVNERFILHQLIEIVYAKEETFYNAETMDISTGGLKCRVKYPIKIGSELYLMFEIKDDMGEDHLIKCYGELSWITKESDTFTVGIKFKDLEEDDIKALENYTKSLESL